MPFRQRRIGPPTKAKCTPTNASMVIQNQKHRKLKKIAPSDSIALADCTAEDKKQQGNHEDCPA